MQNSSYLAARVAGAALLLTTAVAAQGEAATPDGETLFRAFCAACHGLDGKADAVQMDPPPRDLTSGKYTFGNTEAAITKTIRNGFPPLMPPFGSVLDDAQLGAIVAHVRSLMPKSMNVEAPPEISTVKVTDQPVFVRGYLPARGRNGGVIPDGLVLGLPGGASLEYATGTNGLELLRVLNGAFVDRADWRGRGGSPLELLGEAWWTRRTVREPLTARVGGRDLRATLRFRGTSVLDGVATIHGALVAADGVHLATVRETVRVDADEPARFVVRTWELSDIAQALELALPRVRAAGRDGAKAVAFGVARSDDAAAAGDGGGNLAVNVRPPRATVRFGWAAAPEPKDAVRTIREALK